MAGIPIFPKIFLPVHWSVFVLVGLILIVLLASVIGRFLPKKHRVQASIDLDAQPEVVWDLLRDFEKYASWRSGLRRVEKINEQSWLEVDRHRKKVIYGIAEEKSPTRLVVQIRSDNLPYSGQWIYEISREGESTSLTITEEGEVYSPIFRFIGHYIMDKAASIKGFLLDVDQALKST